MEKKDFIVALKEITETDNLLKVKRNVDELRQQFEDYLQEETRLFQIAELEAAEKGETLEQVDWMTPLKEEFYEIYGTYKDKQKKLWEEKKALEEANLASKQALLRKFEALVADEENIGTAFTVHKEIIEKWKEIGDIPRVKRHDIQQRFSRLQEDFFYNIRIYKDIKEYDFQKNFEAKQSVIDKIKTLAESNSIHEVEANIKQLQNDWEDIGPTKQELWEQIKDEYWNNVNKVYEKIRDHYEARREKRKENIGLKQALIQQLEGVVDKTRDSVKAWNENTKEVLSLQQEWKKVGMGTKKENEEVWKVFRGLCDKFFEEKSNYFEKAHEGYDKIAEIKKGLIQKVEELKDSDAWNETTKTIIHLQKQWKNAGNAGRKHEQKLWKQFRTSCDHFFNAKTAHFEEMDKAFEDNLAKKEALIEEIKAFKLPKDTPEAIQALKAYSEQFANLGYVPKKNKDEVYKAYKMALNAHYDALDISGIEKEKILFQARLNTMKGSGDAQALFESEKRTIRNEINKVKQQIVQFENNLGFFSSKGKNPLKEQAEKNLTLEKQKLDALKAKLKLIPNE